MLPQHFVTLDGLPLLPNGKIDRNALPPPPVDPRPANHAERAAPSTPVECAIAEVWCELLGVDSVDLRDNFFDLGGHSLLAMRAVMAIRERHGWRIQPPRFVYETLGQLAREENLDAGEAARRGFERDGEVAQTLGHGRYSAPMSGATTLLLTFEPPCANATKPSMPWMRRSGGKYTANDFTTVQQNGQFVSRSERIGNLQSQKQRPYVPREREQHVQQGDLVATRFFSGGLWVVEVWKRIDGAWATVVTQATTATANMP